jgi:4-azaleucine resistance transporter AzlC
MNSHYKYIKKAFVDSTPVLAAYVPLGIVWGLLWEQASYSPLIGILFSLFIFAGAVQFLGLSFIIIEEPILGIIITVLPIALRNTFYTISMLDRLPKNLFFRSYSAFSLADATFAILINKDEKLAKNIWYSLPLSIFIHSYWTLGTAIGVFSGSFIPDHVKSLDFALPALIAILAMEGLEKTRSFKPLIVTIFAAFISFLVFRSSWLLPAVIICAIFTVLNPNKEVNE